MYFNPQIMQVGMITNCKTQFCHNFSDDQLVASVRDIFAGGTETTYTTLRWALLFLIHHPNWQTKLRKEIDDVIGQDQPMMEHKDQMPLVEAFSLEVQRLGNLTTNAVPHAP